MNSSRADQQLYCTCRRRLNAKRNADTRKRMQGNSSQRNRQTVNQSRDHARPRVWEPRHFIQNPWTQSPALIACTVIAQTVLWFWRPAKPPRTSRRCRFRASVLSASRGGRLNPFLPQEQDLIGQSPAGPSSVLLNSEMHISLAPSQRSTNNKYNA